LGLNAKSGSALKPLDAGNPCGGDIKKLCAGIQPGEGRITACIKSHLTDLSESCEARVLGVGVTGKLCKADFTKLCAGVAPGTAGIRACIKSHMAEVSVLVPRPTLAVRCPWGDAILERAPEYPNGEKKRI